jgi:hypothetical protein
MRFGAAWASGASELASYELFFYGLLEPLKINERLAFWALDRDQISDYFAGFSPAGAGTFGEDVVCFLFKDDPASHPSSAVALMVVIHQGQRRSCHLGQFPSVMWASTLEHGIVSFLIRFMR